MSTVIIHDFVPYVPPAFIPTPTEEDNGKYVGVSEGVYDLSYVDALPTPIKPNPTTNRAELNSIFSDNANANYESKLSEYQITVNGKANGTYVVAETTSTASKSDLLSFFDLNYRAIYPIVGNIVMTLTGVKPDNNGATNTITHRLKMSGYKSFSNSITQTVKIEIYFPYTSYKDETLYKGVFVVTVTAESFTCDYISEN